MTTLKAVLGHFKKVDPELYKAARSLSQEDLLGIEKGLSKRRRPGKLFEDICWSIIGQQLSGKAADTIYARFEKLFTAVTPGAVAKKSLEDFRGMGISYAKGRALHDLATRVSDGRLPLPKFGRMSNEEVRHALIEVKGIGPWTAEMILMFSLNREDIFSYGDLGLQNACKMLYKLHAKPHKEKLEKLSLSWSPYRTWAARILWKYYDTHKKKARQK